MEDFLEMRIVVLGDRDVENERTIKIYSAKHVRNELGILQKKSTKQPHHIQEKLCREIYNERRQ